MPTRHWHIALACMLRQAQEIKAHQGGAGDDGVHLDSGGLQGQRLQRLHLRVVPAPAAAGRARPLSGPFASRSQLELPLGLAHNPQSHGLASFHLSL